jgi:hypothetical protein
MSSAEMGWKRGSRAIAAWGWLVATPVVAANAQTTVSRVATAPETLRVVGTNRGSALEPDGLVLREIEDPSTGNIWQLVRDQNRPAGPGRLVLARQGTQTHREISRGPVQPLPNGERPIIHTGDALILEEHTAVIDARLEAVALQPAVRGALFRARLKISGKVTRVVAISPGRASFAEENEARP